MCQRQELNISTFVPFECNAQISLHVSVTTFCNSITLDLVLGTVHCLLKPTRILVESLEYTGKLLLVQALCTESR